MSGLKIDAYYDITCSHCGFSRSTDFEMGMEMNKARLRKDAKKEGWKVLGANSSQNMRGEDVTLCPICAAKCINIECEPPIGGKLECDLLMCNGFCKKAIHDIPPAASGSVAAHAIYEAKIKG